MTIQTAISVRLAKLSCCHVNPTSLMSTSNANAPTAFASRSMVTSTNGFTRYFTDVGSGRNRISRVVLSTV